MVVIGPMVVIHSAPLASIAGGVLPTFKHCPTLFNEHPCLTQRKVQNVAFATVGHVDSIELVREFLREPDFHGRKESSNTHARTAASSGSEKRTTFRAQPITERSPVPVCNALVAT
jgi:hypothetical protein